jgi:hypothetical protein
MDDIKIELTPESVRETTERLQGISGGAATALKLSITRVLKWSRTRIARQIQSVYETPSYGWLLKAIGEPRMSSPLSGFLRVSGTREKLSDLPYWRDIFPHGVVASITKSKPPAQMLHAFARSGKIYQRIGGQGSSAYPIGQIFGSSVVGMLSEQKHVMEPLKDAMQERLATELQIYIKLVLSGEIIPGGRR